jgi:hypothetical protein
VHRLSAVSLQATTDNQVYSYFQGPRRDSRLARLGVVYLCFMSLAHIVLCNYQTARVITYFDRFAAVLFTDFVRPRWSQTKGPRSTQWLFSLGTLIKLFITVPVLVFFSRRAYIIWNRSKVVLATCLLFDLIGLIGCSIRCVRSAVVSWVMLTDSISQGLKAPWGLGVVSNEEFYRWAPTLGEQVEKLRVMGNVAVSATFGTSSPSPSPDAGCWKPLQPALRPRTRNGLLRSRCVY